MFRSPFLAAESMHIWLPCPSHMFLISPLAMASPGTNNSGYTVSRYHLKDLHLGQTYES